MDTASTRQEVSIEGMTCQHCVQSVRKKLEELPAVESAEVTLDGSRALLSLSGEISQKDLDNALAGTNYKARLTGGGDAEERDDSEQEGFPGEDKKDQDHKSRGRAGTLTFDIEGMHCASCVSKVEKAISSVPGVSAARVNFAMDRATADLSEGADRETIEKGAEQAVANVGYEAHPRREKSAQRKADETRARKEAEVRAWFFRWIVGAVLTLPVMVIEMGGHWFGEAIAFPGDTIVSLVFTTAVMVVAGRHFFVSAWGGLKRGYFHMDSLIALGSGVAFVFSTVVLVGEWLGTTIGSGAVYFETAAMIVTLISVGKWLEARARMKAGESISALMDLAARKARVERNGEVVEIPAEEVQIDDIMVIRPGEKIPTDGVVVSGHSTVDESMVTGESIPADRGENDEVIGATINQKGQLKVRATKVGSETALGQIIEMVERAQESKADIQRLADKVSNVFVPSVMGVAAVTFIAWSALDGDWVHALITAVAVLIVACPCALGLATPTAIMVGTGEGAHRGILIREAEAIERARGLDVIVFDKTGTLTEGKPRVTDLEPVNLDSEEELLRLAGSLEKASEHPLGEAVVRHAGDKDIQLEGVQDFEAITGKGIRGTVDGKELLAGSPRLMEQENINFPDPQRQRREELEREGKTVICLAGEGKLLGMIAIADTIKERGPAVVKELRERLGLAVWLITGDNQRTAEAIAGEAGIEPSQVMAEVAPEDKANKIEELQKDGHRVAMVGDGINDAPALAQADIGIALGTGTDVAMETGSITLVSGELKGVVDAIRLSRATMSKIKQNLFWAFFYNTALIPLAAVGLLAPIWAAAAMALSSVSVVTNSILLRVRMRRL